MYLIKKKRITSNGSRNLKNIFIFCKFYNFCKVLLNKKQSKCGRCIRYGRLVYSKGISITFKFFYLNFYLNFFKFFFCVISFFLDFRRSGFVALLLLPCGG